MAHNELQIANEYIIFGINDEDILRKLFKATHSQFLNIFFILEDRHKDNMTFQQRFFIHKPYSNEKLKEIDDFGSFEAIFLGPLEHIERPIKIGINVGTSQAVNEELMKLFLETVKAPYEVATSRRNRKIEDFMIPHLLTFKEIDLSSNKFQLFKSFGKELMKLKHSYPYEWEKICFLLPTLTNAEPNAINVMKTFTKETWIYSGIVFVCYIILRHLSKSLEIRINRSNESVDLVRTIWTIFEISVTGATVMRFRTLFDKIFMTLFILYCFFLMQFFDSSFVSVGISPTGDKILRTVVEVLAQNQSIYAKPLIYEITQMMFLNSSFQSQFRMSKLKTFNYTSTKFYLMSKQDIETILAAEENFLGASKQQRWYMVDECLYSIPMVFLFSLDSPYRDAFNTFASRIWESGIHQYWEREAKRKANNGTLKFGIPKFLEYEGPIKLKDIWFSFVILGIGLSLSFVVFLLELLVHWAKGFFCIGVVAPATFELQRPLPIGQRQVVLRRRMNAKRHRRRQRGKIGLFNRRCKIM
jgi:hypothetical protein